MRSAPVRVVERGQVAARSGQLWQWMMRWLAVAFGERPGHYWGL